MARLPLGLGGLLWTALGTTGAMADPIAQQQQQQQPESTEPYCPKYDTFSYSRDHKPFSTGNHALPSMRPPPECRTFRSQEVDSALDEMRRVVADPDLFRLFENTWPNTLDTTVAWRGPSAEDPSEELAFIVTGDITAMWLRDSANQLQSYAAVLRHDATPHADTLASLFRGAINLQGRYIRTSPFCNAFQPPDEAVADGVKRAQNGWAANDHVQPSFDESVVFECKYELDSLAAFLQLSHDYHAGTRDVDFFRRTRWAESVDALLAATSQLLEGTYAADGQVLHSAFTFSRQTDTASETVSNRGVGAPVKAGTGLVRSFFRPSDDSCLFQLLVPANMMLARYLDSCARIMAEIDLDRAGRMRDYAASVRRGVEKYGRVKHPDYGVMYAYEVDGYGSQALMDDANIPSLLSAPMLGYVARDDPVYQNTRRYVLSTDNPYFMHGPVINGTGGPHVGPGAAWPMGLIVSLLTSDDDHEIILGLQTLLRSTDGFGLMHETVNSHHASSWTRSWFAWANGLFGQMLLDLRTRKPHILNLSYQK